MGNEKEVQGNWENEFPQAVRHKVVGKTKDLWRPGDGATCK